MMEFQSHGLSAEYLHEHSFQPKVLFATHYHELNEMTQGYERLKTSMFLLKKQEISVFS